jgi:hypothetical protein
LTLKYLIDGDLRTPIKGTTMRVILEVESEADLNQLANFLPRLNLSVRRTVTTENHHRLKHFLQFIDREAVPVERIIIPNREDRNAR